MIRNLKVLIAAAMALMAFGALSATAHAAEEKFHCEEAEPCRATLGPDETAGTITAHHVFVIKGKTSGGAEASASFTCDQLSGEAESATKTATELTFTNLAYKNAAGEGKCKVGASESVTVNFTSCDYKFTSTGGGTVAGSQVHLLCSTAGDGIDILIGGTLCFKITPFTALGIKYHDSEIELKKQTVTATANVVVPLSSVDLINKTCPGAVMNEVTGATYTTGNTLVRAETKGGVADNAWFE
jgi:hypothetical protein